jgi:hypothetical protein
MLKARQTRDGEWTPIPPRLRKEAKRKKCSVCRVHYGFVRFDADTSGEVRKIIRAKEAIHHLIPRRYLESRGVDPHYPLNLISICNECHGKTKVAEDRLFSGDLIGWLREMARINMPMDRIFQVASSLHLTELYQTARWVQS